MSPRDSLHHEASARVRCCLSGRIIVRQFPCRLLHLRSRKEASEPIAEAQRGSKYQSRAVPPILTTCSGRAIAPTDLCSECYACEYSNGSGNLTKRTSS